MGKVANLVWVSVVTRVIVDDNASEEEIMEIALPRLLGNLSENFLEHVEEIIDDLEVPFGALSTD
jgi:hypothetical protein